MRMQTQTPCLDSSRSTCIWQARDWHFCVLFEKLKVPLHTWGINFLEVLVDVTVTLNSSPAAIQACLPDIYPQGNLSSALFCFSLRHCNLLRHAQLSRPPTRTLIPPVILKYSTASEKSNCSEKHQGLTVVLDQLWTWSLDPIYFHNKQDDSIWIQPTGEEFCFKSMLSAFYRHWLYYWEAVEIWLMLCSRLVSY
jgi:hypothetical protein